MQARLLFYALWQIIRLQKSQLSEEVNPGKDRFSDVDLDSVVDPSSGSPYDEPHLDW